MKYCISVLISLILYNVGFSQLVLPSSEYEFKINDWLELKNYSQVHMILEKSKFEIKIIDLSKNNSISITTINRKLFFNKTADIYDFYFSNGMYKGFYHRNVLNGSKFTQVINYKYNSDTANNQINIVITHIKDTLRKADIKFSEDSDRSVCRQTNLNLSLSSVFVNSKLNYFFDLPI